MSTKIPSRVPRSRSKTQEPRCHLGGPNRPRSRDASRSGPSRSHH
jgi:hypothetical protein